MNDIVFHRQEENQGELRGGEIGRATLDESNIQVPCLIRIARSAEILGKDGWLARTIEEVE